MHACMHHHHIQTHIHHYTYMQAYIQPDKLLCAISLRHALAAQSPPNPLVPNSVFYISGELKVELSNNFATWRLACRRGMLFSTTYSNFLPSVIPMLEFC